MVATLAASILQQRLLPGETDAAVLGQTGAMFANNYKGKIREVSLRGQGRDTGRRAGAGKEEGHPCACLWIPFV